MRTHRLSSLVAIGFCLFLFSTAVAQTAKPPAAPGTRLKIGVALEGGGALGLAHIGVLQSLEDQHIPIDYLAGTSMGGLVGGLYALGKSPKQLEDIVRKQDWDFIIAGQTNYEDLSYRRKEDARAYPNLLEFGLKKGISLPSGLNSGQGVSTLIDEQTLPYAHTGSFDDFPIPCNQYSSRHGCAVARISARFHKRVLSMAPRREDRPSDLSTPVSRSTSWEDNLRGSALTARMNSTETSITFSAQAISRDRSGTTLHRRKLRRHRPSQVVLPDRQGVLGHASGLVRQMAP